MGTEISATTCVNNLEPNRDHVHLKAIVERRYYRTKGELETLCALMATLTGSSMTVAVRFYSIFGRIRAKYLLSRGFTGESVRGLNSASIADGLTFSYSGVGFGAGVVASVILFRSP